MWESRILAASALALMLVSCTDAAGEVTGFAPLRPACTPSKPTAAPGGPSTWSSLYADIFGASGKGSCAGDGNCHGAAGQRGSEASAFICSDQAGCYQSLRGKAGNESRALVKDEDAALPEKSKLFGILRITTPDCESGSMPKSSPYRVSAEDTARIYKWIQDGANND